MAKFFTPTRLSENITKTPEGYLVCVGVPIARTGWQEYGDGETPLEAGADGKVWIYRDPEEVFSEKTIASALGKSVTICHPENEFVNPENWKELTYGQAHNIREGKDLDEEGEQMLLADLLITDEIAIGLVDKGLREVSCGYEAEYEQTGEGEGRQFNIVMNHIALVEQGRAGPTYAIKDHKGKVNIMDMKKLAEAIKNLGKMVALDAAKKKKTADAEEGAEKKKSAEDAEEGMGYDELVKAVEDLGEQIKSSKKGEDEDEEESEDEDGDMSKMEERLKACEAAIAKLLKSKGGDEEEKESKDEEESEDEESEMSGDSDESEDDAEEAKKTGDTARIEVLAPGLKAKGKDARLEALKVFGATDEGKKILKSLNNGKTLVMDSKTKNIDMIFMAASTLAKATRGTGLEKTKDAQAFEVGDNKDEAVTAEKLNEINAAHWAKKN